MESARRQPRAQLPKDEAERLAEDDAGRVSAQRDSSTTVEDIDDLLEEIDALLEEQSVLTHFRQKGGE